MAEIIWTEPALLDLDEIAEYIAIENIIAAKNLVRSIFDKVDRLEQFPESGRTPPEIPHLNHREVVASPCRVFYKIADDNVYILFVMREERDLRKFLISKQ